MQTINDVSKIWKTVQRKFIFIWNVRWESSIHFIQLSIVIDKKILVFSHEIVFIEIEAALLSVTMRERAMAFAATI